MSEERQRMRNSDELIKYVRYLQTLRDPANGLRYDPITPYDFTEGYSLIRNNAQIALNILDNQPECMKDEDYLFLNVYSSITKSLVDETASSFSSYSRNLSWMLGLVGISSIGLFWDNILYLVMVFGSIGAVAGRGLWIRDYRILRRLRNAHEPFRGFQK